MRISLARPSAFVATLVLLSSPALAAGVHVDFRSHGPQPTHVALTFRSATSPNSEVELSASEIGAGADVSLAQGHWCVSSDPRFAWSADRCFDVMAATPSEIVLDIFQSGALRGEVKSASKSAPTTLEVRFEGTSPDKSHVEGSVQCPLLGDKLAFVCYVPVGILNTRLRVHHHIALYRFGLAVTPSSERQLGVLRMEEGASISGTAELPRDIIKKPTDVIVTARPSGAHESGPQMILGAMLLPQSAPLEPNGWWHIDGLTPGEYAVSAKGPGLLRSDEYLVIARRNADMELMTPLVVQHPHHLALHVTPPFLDGAPWRVTISREIVVGQAETIGQSVLSREGRWQSQILQPGRYVVELRSPDDESVWATERVEISSRDEHREISIASRHITG